MIDMSNLKCDSDQKVIFSYADLIAIEQFPEGPLFEIIKGVLFMVPSPTLFHQQISMSLSIILTPIIRKLKLGKSFAAPIDVVLSPRNVVIPDFVLVKNLNILEKRYINGSPDLIIEILSSNKNNEPVIKKSLYEHYKISEYVIIDPILRQLIVYRLKEGNFSEGEIYGVKDKLQLNTIPTSISVKDIFEE